MHHPGRDDRGDHHAGRSQQDETEVTCRHSRLRIARSKIRCCLIISRISDHQPGARGPGTSRLDGTNGSPGSLCAVRLGHTEDRETAVMRSGRLDPAG